MNTKRKKINWVAVGSVAAVAGVIIALMKPDILGGGDIFGGGDKKSGTVAAAAMPAAPEESYTPAPTLIGTKKTPSDNTQPTGYTPTSFNPFWSTQEDLPTGFKSLGGYFLDADTYRQAIQDTSTGKNYLVTEANPAAYKKNEFGLHVPKKSTVSKSIAPTSSGVALASSSGLIYPGGVKPQTEPAVTKKFTNTMGGSSKNTGGTWVGSSFYRGRYN